MVIVKKKPHKLWDEVASALKSGKPPQVELGEASRVRMPSRPVGRPRKRKIDGWPLKTPSGRRMRCRVSGCKQDLRSGDTIVCSAECAEALRAECQLLLGILDGNISPTELPWYMRTNKLRRKPTL